MTQEPGMTLSMNVFSFIRQTSPSTANRGNFSIFQEICGVKSLLKNMNPSPIQRCCDSTEATTQMQFALCLFGGFFSYRLFLKPFPL